MRRDVLVAGWLSPDSPHVNLLDHGIEDIHYKLLLDAVFVHRMYGPGGLSSRLEGAVYPRLTGATPISFAGGPPFIGGQPSTINFIVVASSRGYRSRPR